MRKRMTGAVDDWNLYRTFLAAVRAGSLSAAARRLGTTQPTAGRQIEQLEAALGGALFTRSPRGLTPTALASQLVPFATQMAAAAEALERANGAGTEDLAGTVRITAGTQIGVEVLPPLLCELAREYPTIQIELAITSATEDLLNRSADIAVRFRRPTQQALTAHRAGRVAMGLFAAPEYVERHGAPKSLAELTAHRLIWFDRERELTAAFRDVVNRFRRDQFAYRSDSLSAQLALIRAGAGIGACHAPLAARWQLVPVLARELRFERPVWLVMHSDLRRTRRVRVVFEALQRGLREYLSPGWTV